MVNEFNRLLSILVCMFSASCASVKQQAPVEHILEFSESADSSVAKKIWSKKMSGLITDLNISENGEVVLVATVPDYEQDGSSAADLKLSAFRPDGDLIWSLPLGSPVKGQSVSDDGKFVVFSNHNEEVMGVDSKGKVTWTQQANCRPHLLSKSKRVLCYHDDDAVAEVGFETWSWAGERVSEFKEKRDVLALKFSPDENWIAAGMTQGSLAIFDSKSKLVWRGTLPGEIQDLAVTSVGDGARVAVLYQTGEGTQKLVMLDRSGKKIAEGLANSHLEQIDIGPSGEWIATYGNGPKGQWLSLFGAKLEEKWKHHYPRYADYSSSILALGDTIITGLEDNAPGSRHSHLLGFDLDGKLRWNIALMTEDGAYLYAHGFAEKKRLLAVATDDGVLSVYEMEKAAGK